MTFNNNTSNTARYLMGFSPSDGLVAGTSQTGSGCINLLATKTIHLTINNIIEILSNDFKGSSIVIPLNVNYGTIQNYNPSDSFLQYITFDRPTKIFHVRVFDENGNALSLLNADWNMILRKV